ncbi:MULTISPECIES: beta-propeller fold lactonase family protein [unclassified Curtobacterium]|uniref:lactonase family protein n=1 Tax=unclassified Curtobacterium TaxID=257496 RepID=UPI000D884306|nr:MULTISPECIES: beta-propeller fold lactonase family protein [unclassified Curtobacterium]PYY65875.1 lactonase family protein [Curtobacterium sp. MCPF17_003]PZF28922.1 lactonase family protein [Curtobacterium sp. MCPF17_051]WIB71359.1 beta-propeller fold lactonase family protein [Curtobacterium sp. MCBD17_026]
MSAELPSLLIGSYTATGAGNATGISLVDAGPAGAVPAPRTVAVLDDPSFLAVSADRVYAVSETNDGAVSAFRLQGGALEHLWDAPAGGDAPCHVRVDPSGALVVTNYVSGTVAAISLAPAESHAASVTASDGVVLHGDATQRSVPAEAVAVAALPDATGPDDDRQDGPHAHQSIATPDGTVLVADLGGDALHEFRVTVSAHGVPDIEALRVHHVTPGAGPRHMAWIDGDLLVAGELDGRVHRLRRDDSGSFVTIAAVPTFDGAVGESLLSHIEVDDAGRAYVAVRGRDLLVVLDARDGGLAVVGSVPCGGVWPRHFARVPGFVLVANQMSDAVAVLPLDAEGMPGEAVAQIPVGTPTCVVPL